MGRQALRDDLAEYPGRNFHRMIARDSEAINSSTRTLNFTMDIDASSGELLPSADGTSVDGTPVDLKNKNESAYSF